MISGKKVLIVGAGNAGRPVANLFNYLGNDVIVTDSNTFEMLPKKAQNKIKNLKEKGITFDLGNHSYDLLNSVDAIYISPNIPKTVDFIKKIYELATDGKFDIIENNDVGKILNSLIAIPMIGIAGTDGKTTTTNMVNYALEDKFDTIIFSSLQNSLVIEGLVEMVVNSQFENKELAVLELPHGTIRMAEGLELDACIITNLTPDHMDEFNTYEDYIERNIAIEKLLKDNGLVLANGDDPIISSRLNTFTHDSIVYGLKDPHKIDFEGKEYYNEDVDYDIFAYDIVLNGLDGSSYKIKSNELPTSVCSNCGETSCNCGDYSRKTIPKFEREVNIKVPGMINVENSLATILSSLIMGIDLEDAINRMANFNGVKGRFEKIDNFNNINIFMDAAHNPESMEKLFDGLDVSGRLILSLDNPDTLTSRDKTKIGEVLGKFIDVLIVSSKNETTEVIDYDAAFEVVDGAFSSHGEIESYITETVYESISYALAIADEEDTILHIGPGVVNAYDSVKNDIIDAIKFYKAISGEVAVIGGCGTVGSLMARVLACNNVDVTVSDSAKDTPLMKVFKDEGIKLDLGQGHDEKLLNDVSSFFLAPSLMKNDKLKDKLKKANSDNNVPILGIDEIFRSFKSNKNVFGITGTNGKTTTREILKNIFRVSGLKVPEHHLDMQGNTEFIPALQSKLDGDVAVIEIGTFGNKGEIESISKNAEVDTGIITNISQDHLSNGSFDDYINCKKEIVDVADNLILCGDDPIVSYFGYLKDDEDLLFFGIADDNESLENNELSSDFKESRICPKCGKELIYDNYYLGHLGKFYCDCGFKNPELDVVAKNIHFNQDGSLQYNLVIYENEGKVTLENGSIANVYNSLAAASGAWLSGIDFKYIIEGINSFKGVDGRLQIINENPKIILDYAHNPAGVKSIIQTLTTLIKNSKSNNKSNSKSSNKFNNKIDNEFSNRNENKLDNKLNNKSDSEFSNGNENKLDNKLNNENKNKNDVNGSKKDYYDKLIIVNTISSESGEEGDLEIAKLLSNADIVIPASHAAYDSAKFINNVNCEVKIIQSSKQGTKVGTLGANFEQVKEALKLAISIASFNDIILIIGEGGLKYSLKILNEVDFDNKGDI